MRLYYVFVTALVCCFLGCQKEPDEVLTPPNCKLDRLLYYDEQGNVDTGTVEYNGDQVSRVNYGDFYVEFEYANGLVSKKKYYFPDLTVSVDQVTYNPDSTISRVDRYLTFGGQQSTVLADSYHFIWVGKQLAKLETWSDTSGTGLALIWEDLFTYTGNNISKVVFNDFEFQYSDTTNFFYDSKLNYYRKDPALLLSDILFVNYLGESMAFALSVNNVVSLDHNDPSSKVNLTYGETDKQAIESLTVDGNIYSRYKYNCQ